MKLLILIITVLTLHSCSYNQQEGIKGINQDSLYLPKIDTSSHVIITDSAIYGPFKTSEDLDIVQWEFLCKLPEGYKLKHLGDLYYIEVKKTRFALKQFASLDSCNTMRNFNRWLSREKNLRQWPNIQIGN